MIVKIYCLILFAFASVFFPRIFDTVGFPPVVNFVHFAIVPFVVGIALFKARPKHKTQIVTTKLLLAGLLAFLALNIASALFNRAGVINAILQFLLLAEPFMLLAAIISLAMPTKTIAKFRGRMVNFVFIHIFLAFVQAFLVYNGIIGLAPGLMLPDNVQGVFYASGAGHVVGASVSVTFGLYYFFNTRIASFWMRSAVLGATLLQLLLSDAKQVVVSFVLAWVLLILSKVQDFGKLIQYIIAAVLVGGILIWSVQNLEVLQPYLVWVRPDIYGPDGEATRLKFSSIRIVSEYIKSPIQALFGLGPGHTVGRLGAFMLTKYEDLLRPIGATVHPVSNQVLRVVDASWLGGDKGSSFFSPLYGWVAIWGDLGWLGLSTYLFLWYIVWRKLCIDDLTKLFVLTVFIFGFIFTQMEEPGYMLFVTSIIGIQWQEHQLYSRTDEEMWLTKEEGRRKKEQVLN